MLLAGLGAICFGLMMVCAAWISARFAAISDLGGRFRDGLILMAIGLVVVAMAMTARGG
jgi:hypothetical protein